MGKVLKAAHPHPHRRKGLFEMETVYPAWISETELRLGALYAETWLCTELVNKAGVFIDSWPLYVIPLFEMLG